MRKLRNLSRRWLAALALMLAFVAGAVANVQNIDVGVSGVTGGVIHLFGSTSGFTTLQAPAVAGSATFTFPPNNGSNTNCLITDGSGGTSWSAGCGGGGGGSTTIVAPQGRLTLTTGTPYMGADVTAVSLVYYTCAVGNNVPYYTGSADALDTISSCEVSTTMATSGTGVTNSGDNFDVWWVHGGANRICVATNGSGGGWASDTGGSATARGTGYTQVHNTRGYITNVNAITHCYNGTTDYGSVSADQATLLGTLRTTAAGKTGNQFQAAAATGGANPCVCLVNVYNLTLFNAVNVDDGGGSNWTYASSTIRSSNGSANNAIRYVDPLGRMQIQGTFLQDTDNAAGQPGAAQISVNRDSNTANGPSVSSAYMGTGTFISSNRVISNFAPSVGFHTIYSTEACNGGTCTFYRLTSMGLTLSGQY